MSRNHIFRETSDTLSTSSPLISVVICTHNRANYLAKAIQSVVEQRVPRDCYELIIVDNRSDDQTKAVVEHFMEKYNLHYYFEPTLGLNHARNAGSKYAKGRFVAYLDDDAVAKQGWLQGIIKVFETVRPTPGCVGGKAFPIWEAPRPIWLSDEILTSLTVIDWSDKPRMLKNINLEWLVGANIAFPIEVLKRIGGFHVELDRAGNSLLSSGDIFLQKRILASGYTCFYHPDIAVGHHISSLRLQKKWFHQRYYWQGRSDAKMQLIENEPSVAKCLHLATKKLFSLIRSPKKIVNLFSPTNDPIQFTERCFTLITVGHIWGLLSTKRR